MNSGDATKASPDPAILDRGRAKAEIERTVNLLFEPDQVIELRAFKQNGKWQNTHSGYFLNRGKLIDAALKLDSIGCDGVYIVLNEVNPELFARRADVAPELGQKDGTTLDTDIIRRHWLFVDCDAGQTSGISSSNEELANALELANDIKLRLAAAGWPAPLLALSGNGAHLLFKIDLPAEDGGIIKAILQALDALTKGQHGKAHVDTGVFNPARLCRLWGTTARKGSNVEGRPHRTSRIIEAPAVVEVVSVESLQTLAAQTPKEEPKRSAPPKNKPPRTGDGNLSWGQAAMDGELERVRAARDGERNNILNKAAFALGSIVAGGSLERADVESALEAAASEIGLGAAEARKTIQSGMESGGENPRTAPEQPRRRGGIETPKPGMLEEAVLVIAGKCDGAASDDGVGFSAADVHWFAPHVETARTGGCIVGSLRKKVATRLEKYGSQLKDGGININSLVAAEEARFAALEEAEKEAKPETRSDLTPAQIGRMLSTEHHWLFHHERLHVYRDGYYQPDGERLARARTQEILGSEANEKAGKEVVYWLSVAHYRPPEAVDADNIINVQNGLLDAKTGKLAPHSPGHLSTIRLPVAWAPAAQHQRFDAFLNEVLPDAETRSILEEALGYLLFPDCRYEKAFMLTGEGANGKSVLLTAIEAMIGKQNISNLKLQEVGERFSTAQLVGRLANVFADLPRDALQDTGAFKMLVSGDRQKAERKHKDPFEFANRAKLWFSANELPKTRDKTTAFWRRWIVVPFPHSFLEGDPRRDPHLKAKLQEPEARAYLLRLAVEGFQRLVARGHFIESQATRRALNQYKVESDSLTAFIDERLVLQDAAFVPKQALFDAYRDWCATSGLPPMNKLTLGRELHRLIPSLCESKRTVGGKRFVHCWVNVGLLDTSSTPPPGKDEGCDGLDERCDGFVTSDVTGSKSDESGSLPGCRVDSPLSRGKNSETSKRGEREEGESEHGAIEEAPVISNATPTRQPGNKAMDTAFQPVTLPVTNQAHTRHNPSHTGSTVGNASPVGGADAAPPKPRRYREVI